MQNKVNTLSCEYLNNYQNPECIQNMKTTNQASESHVQADCDTAYDNANAYRKKQEEPV